MGYFDALAAGSFRTAPDGRRLFFPWGIFGRGYVIGSEAENKHLRRRVMMFTAAGTATAITAAMAAMIPAVMKMAASPAPNLIGELGIRGLVVAVVCSVVYIAFYVAWLPSLRRGLQPSSERLTMRENMAAQARAQSPVLLWAGEICSLAFVAGGVFTIVFVPVVWPVALITVLFFGICAVIYAFMLALRQT